MTSTTAQCTCAVPAGSSAPRCPWCPLTATAPNTNATKQAPTRVFASAPEVPHEFRYSRWAKGPTTFGPMGRVLATLALLVPLPVLAMSFAIGIGIAGTGLYCLVVMPLALRHIWAKAKIVVR